MLQYSIGHLKIGHAKMQVHLYYLVLPGVILIHFHGGRPHIGALSFVLSPDVKSDIQTISVPGHKENLITSKAGSFLLKKLKTRILVTGGIHYDKITKKNIQSIIQNCQLLCKKLVVKLR